MLYQSRKTVGSYFGLKKPSDVVFTKNSTEAINLFFNSVLEDGDHVIISSYEHNAVLRPLHSMKEKGIIDYSVIDSNDLEKSPEYLLDKYCKKNTKVIAMTLASNLTGRVIFKKELYKLAKEKGLITFIDSSQGAGKLKLNMVDNHIDFLAFTGHKDLMAFPGVGGLCCSDKNLIKPLIQGGTGVLGDSYVNPDVFPEGLEAGTLNMPSIWSLKCSIDYITNNFEYICRTEKENTDYLVNELKKNNNIIIYDADVERVSTVGINIKNMSSEQVVKCLDENDICVRGGIHCAILAHETLGTVDRGVVRISLNYLNSIEEIDRFLNVLKEFCA